MSKFTEVDVIIYGTARVFELKKRAIEATRTIKLDCSENVITYTEELENDLR